MSDKKINLFKDSEYEEFDWLNKAIEPTLFSVADQFASLPSVVEIPLVEALTCTRGSWNYEISLLSILNHKIQSEIDYRDVEYMREFFSLEMDDKELIVDLRSIPTDKVIRFTKKVDVLPEDYQRRMVSNKINRIIKDHHYYNNRDDIGRLSEVMDVLGCDTNRRSRSKDIKWQTISTFYQKIILEDKWRIRNLDLAIRAAHWMVQYVSDGNMASFQNFIKLKCMTHSDNPIYSIQETV